MDRNILLVLGMSMVMFSPVINADGILDESLSKNWHPVIGIGGGDTSTTNLGTSKYFPAQNPLTDEYYAYSPHNHRACLKCFWVLSIRFSLRNYCS